MSHDNRGRKNLKPLAAIPWAAVKGARAVAWACRLDRSLQEAAEAAAPPQHRLATALRARLARGAAEAEEPRHLFSVIEAVHEGLEYLPPPPLPTGLRVFLRELFGLRWDEGVVVAPTSRARWPRTSLPAADEAPAEGVAGTGRPVALIPWSELHNPLLWPLVSLQAAAFDGWQEVAATLTNRLGPALDFARAEALAAVRPDAAERLWREAAAAMDEGGAPARLAASLADGVLISAHRRRPGRETASAGHPVGANPGDVGEPLGGGEGPGADGGSGPGDGEGGSAAGDGEGGRAASDGESGRAAVYARLAAAYDEPADAADILRAGWLHWHRRALRRLLDRPAATAARWEETCRFVHGVDDLLRRSLDVAAIHRFYATGGRKHDLK